VRCGTSPAWSSMQAPSLYSYSTRSRDSTRVCSPRATHDFLERENRARIPATTGRPEARLPGGAFASFVGFCTVGPVRYPAMFQRTESPAYEPSPEFVTRSRVKRSGRAPRPLLARRRSSTDPRDSRLCSRDRRGLTGPIQILQRSRRRPLETASSTKPSRCFLRTRHAKRTKKKEPRNGMRARCPSRRDPARSKRQRSGDDRRYRVRSFRSTCRSRGPRPA